MNEKIIEQKSAELLQKIRSARPALDIKGTVYYVSADGDDSADGKTPETAWKTPEAVTNATSFLQPGDAVLFRCGDVFRGIFKACPGVTYSLYGNGEKPQIYGADENAVELTWEKEEQEFVWSVKLPHNIDIGCIVFDHGKEWGYKKFRADDIELEMDLDFRSDRENGIVYLYSEKGNPSERWTDIELCKDKTIIGGVGDGVTIDSLVLKYGSAHAIGISAIDYSVKGKPSFKNLKNFTVRNCEFEWIGGGIQFSETRFGNAIEIWGGCDGVTIENNYINQVFDAAITQQYSGLIFGDPVMTDNVTMRGNLIENSTYSFELFLNEKVIYEEGKKVNDMNSDWMIRNMLFESNICRNAGYGWGNQRYDRNTPAHIKTWNSFNHSENFVVRGNIFDRADYRLLEINAAKDEWLPKLENNVYCQYVGKEWINSQKKISIFNRDTIKNPEENLAEKDAICAVARR